MAARKRRRSGSRAGKAGAVKRSPEPAPLPPPPPADSAKTRLLVAVVLAVATLVGFWGVLDNGFVNFDDNVYVTENPYVQQGFGAAGVEWAWTTGRAGNWHPLTWMSHMLDWRLYGSSPRGHHLSSLLLHLANTLLLFVVIERMTGKIARSAFVAAVFALHPLHVESVAWVAERKDVLSTLMALLTILAYLRYVKSRTTTSYSFVVLALALGLAAKPMLVTLPFVILLLDYWPLGRWTPSEQKAATHGVPWALVLEKIPLFAVAAASSVVTYLVQSAGRTVGSVELYPLAVRVSNAIVSYAEYLWKTIWPQGLAVYYPHPGDTIPLWQVAISAVVLVLITVLAFRLRRSHPYAIVGWLWYVGTLVPVIGLVQVGAQAMADRYTYVPLIGIFLIVAWAVPDALRTLWPAGARDPAWALVPGIVVVLLLGGITRAQVRHWKDSETLFDHALAVTENNFMAHNNIGIALEKAGRQPEAADHYAAAIRLRPHFAEAHINLGILFQRQGRSGEAFGHLTRALEIDSGSVQAHYNLGVILSSKNETEQAIRHYEQALRLDPAHHQAHNNLANALGRTGKVDQALRHYETAIRLKPDYGQAYSNLAGVLVYKERYAEAWAAIKNARRFGYEPPPRIVRPLSEKMPEPP